MDKIAENISKILLENKVISLKDIDTCNYGIVLFLTSVLEIGAVLVISLFVRNFVETVIFLVGFLPIRIYAGGYHANSKLRCFVILILVYILFSLILTVENLLIYHYAMIIVSIINIVFIYLWAPLGHKNKSLSQKERKIYKNISIILAVVEGIIILLLDLFHIYNKYSIALFLGLLTVVVSLMTGKIKEFLTEGRY